MANIQTAAYKAATQKARELGYVNVDDATVKLREQGKTDNAIGIILGVNKSTFFGWCSAKKETAPLQPRRLQPRKVAQNFAFNYEFPDEPHLEALQAIAQSRTYHGILDDSDCVFQTWSQTLGGRS